MMIKASAVSRFFRTMYGQIGILYEKRVRIAI